MGWQVSLVFFIQLAYLVLMCLCIDAFCAGIFDIDASCL